MAGLALLVQDKNYAVIANIVGNVSIGQIVKIAWRMDKFPKDLLKKFMHAPANAEPSQKEGEKSEAK